MACEGRAEWDHEAAGGCGCCVWCDLPIKGTKYHNIGGELMHDYCAKEYYGIVDDTHEPEPDECEDLDDICVFEDDGQPTTYEEYQDLHGGDDWDHGQFDGEF